MPYYGISKWRNGLFLVLVSSCMHSSYAADTDFSLGLQAVSRLDKMLSSRKLLEQNYEVLLEEGLVTGTEKVLLPDALPYHIDNYGNGWQLTVGGLTLIKVADAIRIYYNEPGVEKLGENFERHMLNVLNEVERPPTLVRSHAMALLRRVYLNPDWLIVSVRNTEMLEKTALLFAKDQDMRVRRQAVGILMDIALESRSSRTDINALLLSEIEIEPQNKVWQDFLLSMEGLQTPDYYRSLLVSEPRFEELKHSSDHQLLDVAAGTKEGEAWYAVKLLTNDWQHTTQVYGDLAKLIRTSKASILIIRALARPVLSSSSDIEKQNFDTLLRCLDELDPEILRPLYKDMRGDPLNIILIDLISCEHEHTNPSEVCSASSLYGVDAVIDRIESSILRSDALPEEIEDALQRISSAARNTQGLLPMMKNLLIALRNELSARPISDKPAQWDRVSTEVDAMMATIAQVEAHK